jgi:hypothetical protein
MREGNSTHDEVFFSAIVIASLFPFNRRRLTPELLKLLEIEEEKKGNQIVQQQIGNLDELRQFLWNPPAAKFEFQMKIDRGRLVYADLLEIAGRIYVVLKRPDKLSKIWELIASHFLSLCALVGRLDAFSGGGWSVCSHFLSLWTAYFSQQCCIFPVHRKENISWSFIRLEISSDTCYSSCNNIFLVVTRFSCP